ncbi:hypothetical protein GJ496_008449, partial [Pomphorhynchus laevis]
NRLCFPREPEQDKFNGYINIGDLNIQQRNVQQSHFNRIVPDSDSYGVVISFSIDDVSWIPTDLKSIMKEKFVKYLDWNGHFTVYSETTRSALLNQAECMDKIRRCIRYCENSKCSNDEPTSFYEKPKFRALDDIWRNTQVKRMAIFNAENVNSKNSETNS